MKRRKAKSTENKEKENKERWTETILKIKTQLIFPILTRRGGTWCSITLSKVNKRQSTPQKFLFEITQLLKRKILI